MKYDSGADPFDAELPDADAAELDEILAASTWALDPDPAPPTGADPALKEVLEHSSWVDEAHPRDKSYREARADADFRRVLRQRRDFELEIGRDTRLPDSPGQWTEAQAEIAARAWARAGSRNG